jgi:hypothetical protein
MQVWQIEDAVFAVEGIRIVVRASPNLELGDYRWQNAAAGNLRISEWRQNRLDQVLNGQDAVIVAGSGSLPPAHTQLNTVRNTYS